MPELPRGAPSSPERRCHKRRNVISNRLVTVDIGAQRGVPVLDLSEGGIGVQAFVPVNPGSSTLLRFDLPDAGLAIEASGVVCWIDASGRTGIRFVSLSEMYREALREWLGRDLKAAALRPMWSPAADPAPQLAGLEREIAERNLSGDDALRLLVERARSVVHADGIAIGLCDPHGLICHASSGEAPQVGVLVQPESHLTLECMRKRALVRCDNALLDARLHRPFTSRLGFSSAVIVPVLAGKELLGVLEAFSARTYSFDQRETALLERLAELIAKLVG